MELLYTTLMSYFYAEGIILTAVLWLQRRKSQLRKIESAGYTNETGGLKRIAACRLGLACQAVVLEQLSVGWNPISQSWKRSNENSVTPRWRKSNQTL